MNLACNPDGKRATASLVKVAPNKKADKFFVLISLIYVLLFATYHSFTLLRTLRLGHSAEQRSVLHLSIVLVLPPNLS